MKICSVVLLTNSYIHIIFDHSTHTNEFLYFILDLVFFFSIKFSIPFLQDFLELTVITHFKENTVIFAKDLIYQNITVRILFIYFISIYFRQRFL